MREEKSIKRFQLLRSFLIILGTFFFVFAYFEDNIFDFRSFLVLLGFWLVSVFFYVLFKRAGFKKEFLLLELFADLVLLSLLVYFTGGRDSPFIFLYPLLIFTASFHFGRRGADVFTLAALLLYSLIFWKPPRPEFFSPETILQFFVPLGAMGLLGALALKWAEEVRQTREKYRQASEALFRAEELHRHILHSLASGLIITDLNYVIVSANQAAEEILDQKDLQGKRLDQVIPGLDLAVHSQRAELVIKKSPARYLGYSLFPLKDERETVFGYGFIFQDITEIKEQERRLRQAEHLAALGTMASGLVHEIKNPLASICGAVEFLKEGSLVKPEGQRLLEIISRETARLDKLVNDFLLFARPGEGTPGWVSLKKLLRETYEELKLVRADFFLKESLPEKLHLFLEQGRLKQILLNLFLNALEATEEQVIIEVWFEPNRDQGRLFFRDNAGGIPPEIIDRIFEPFFTTKPQGTGLGLAVVYSLVKNWGGTITVEPGPQGTTFVLSLPKEKFSLKD